MTAALRHLEPAGQVTRQPTAPRRGRPRGSIGPLALWLHPQIVRFKAQGANCTNVFRSLSVVEGGGSQSFSISSETADSYYAEVGGDIAGMTVTLVNFKKIWQRVN